jgi:regulator of sirC expression with transglutaminase-like and TPR domain
VRLDVASFCIAAHAHVGLDVDAWCRRLDDLAAGCPEPTFDSLRGYLFEREHFRGNTDDYADPENSFLDAVMTRRVGIPITLSVLMIETGRRLGVDVRGVGMPGHFLVDDPARPGVWCDPFHGGALCDLDECRRLFERVHGAGIGFRDAYLAPTSSHEILSRMLANLEHGRLAEMPTQLEWICALHLEIPGLSDADERRLRNMMRTARSRWN